MELAELSSGAALARRILDDLARATADPPGVTRASYGLGEQYAHDLVRREGEAIGARSRIDAAGNLYLTRRGRNPDLPALFIGSHLDSVPHGGNFDGAAGVVAGLATMAELAARDITIERDLTVMATRAEESVWFPLCYPGTQAALGLLPAEALEARRADTGRTLAEHMAETGFDPDTVRRGMTQIDPSRVRAFVEIHIEQGPRLIHLDRPIAVVTATNGGFRHLSARCLGYYAHSGGEPRVSRQDSVLGFSDLVQGLETIWDAVEADGDQVTISFVRVESDPEQHGGGRVLGEIGFSLDVRSEHERVLARIASSLAALCSEIEARRGVTFALGEALTWPPTPMNDALIARLSSAAERLGLDAPLMSSGGGHDAAAFAAAGIPSAMVFLRNANGSHNPEESLEMPDLNQAIRLLVEFVTSFDAVHAGEAS